METKRITDLNEIPLTERYGVWARWSPDHQYLYLVEKDNQPVFQSCLEVSWSLPESQTPTCLLPHTDVNGRIFGTLWA